MLSEEVKEVLVRRTIGWTLVILPAGFIVVSLVATVLGALVGTSAEGEFTTSLIILGMFAVVALVPIGIGTLVLLSGRHEPTSSTGPHGTGPGRERLGWALLVPGVVFIVLTVIGLFTADTGGMTAVGAVGVFSLVLLAVGTWLVQTARRRPDVPSSPPPSPDRELQDH